MTLKNLTSVMVLAVCFVLASGRASAEIGLRGWGPRVGISNDPDQVFGGAHFDLGEFAPHWRFQPSVDFGFGDDVFSFTGNAMAAYYFPLKNSEFTPYAGGQLTAAWFNYDNHNGNSDSDSEIALGIVGGIETKLKKGSRFLAEIQIGGGDLPDFKLLAGWTF